MLHTIGFFYFTISRKCCIALALHFNSIEGITLHSRNICNISIKRQNVLHFIRHQVTQNAMDSTLQVEHIIKQLFGCNCVGQCVKYYCVFMQLPMPYHSIEHTNAPYWAFHGLGIIMHSNLALSVRNTKCKTWIDIFYWKCAFLCEILCIGFHGFVWLWCNVKCICQRTLL